LRWDLPLSLLYRTVKDPDYSSVGNIEKVQSSLKDVVKYKNIKLAMIAMCGVMACLFVLSAMLPNYLTDYLNIGMEQMGFIAAGPGFGGASHICSYFQDFLHY